jgi:hypothetical protein
LTLSVDEEVIGVRDDAQPARARTAFGGRMAGSGGVEMDGLSRIGQR